MTSPKFWESKSLAAMTSDEWESLCDGCGKCCVIKLEDVDDGSIHYTDIGCRLLDGKSCQCKDYSNRKKEVPDCVILSPSRLDSLPWMPSTCAYRLLHEGKDLPLWHPLVSGDKESVHKAGISVRNQIFPEDDIAEDDYPAHIKVWD
ncbi:MAG: YcgN family cysteine cluster protein [Alphaproteobacteria bacterium]|nr:YcgN family cysteine cluster protein [Alphaproteobacteria bacterium]